jgi:transcriptional regulator with XRE-family HTH domain
VPGASSDLERFAADLRAVREERGLTLLETGAACGVHYTVIARLENGKREPRLTTITRLARGLGVPAADLLRGL